MAAVSWQPKTFIRFERSLSTSTQVAKVVTDAGHVYLKGLGNPEGPHALASELVGTRLARLFDLPTLDHAILRIDATVDEIPLYGGGKVTSGSAYCTREEEGHVWGGDAEELARVENQQDMVRLVVFDTWVRNRDRHHPDYAIRKPNRDNVFLSSQGTEEGRYRLLAIDHTHCFGDGNALSSRLARIDAVQDTKIYGLFPEFAPYFNMDTLLICVADLGALTRQQVEQVIQNIPVDWEVDQAARDALVRFLMERAQFVAGTIIDRLQREDGSWAFL